MIEVYHSDAVTLLGSLEPESVQIVMTDPPYGIAYHSNYYKETNPHDRVAHDFNFQIGSFLAAVGRVLRPGGALYLFSRWDVSMLWSREFTASLAVKNKIVWMKDNWSAGDLKGNFGNQYEEIIFAVKGRHKIRGKRIPNVWQVARIPSKRLRCATEKPVELYERAITASSDEADLIVDPFCGSGTAGEAAQHLGRKVICGDIDPKMVTMTAERMGVDCPIVIQGTKVPICPVFDFKPAHPSDWGIHPEDVGFFIEKAKESHPIRGGAESQTSTHERKRNGIS